MVVITKDIYLLAFNNGLLINYGHLLQDRTVGAYSGSNTGIITYPLGYEKTCSSFLATIRNNPQVIASCELVNTSQFRILYHSHSGASQYVYGVCWISYGF